MSKNKVYILSEEMRASKSGFFIEGTDIEMDYPDTYPLPMETEVLENGAPVALRILPNCSYLEKELQIKNGYPVAYKYTEPDRKKLTFRHARLELDARRDKLWIEYIERAAWMKGNEDRKPRPNTRTIYQEYNEEVLLDAEIGVEEMIHHAKTKVFALGEVELKDLYRLSVGGNYVESSVNPKQMRRYLLSVAEHNPEFITAGVKTTRDRLTVLCNKAVEYRILSFNVPGKVSLYVEASQDWVSILELNDTPEGKFNTFIEYLMTDLGQAELSIIENRVKEKEAVDEEEETKPEIFVHDEDKTTSSKRKK